MDKDLYLELDIPKYETFLRKRITELRLQRNLSEHALSLQLGKNGSYIRTITSKKGLPSVKELFNIMIFFEVTPADFLEGFENFDGAENYKDFETSMPETTAALRTKLIGKIEKLPKQDLEKLSLFLSWIEK